MILYLSLLAWFAQQREEFGESPPEPPRGEHATLSMGEFGMSPWLYVRLALAYAEGPRQRLAFSTCRDVRFRAAVSR